MNKSIVKVYISLILFSVMFLAGCSSELNENLSSPPPIGVHPSGISNPNSGDFHGILVANGSANLSECKSCHGGNLRGNGQAANCLSCHSHPSTMLDPSSSQFHGKMIKAKNWDMSDCQGCHGVLFDGGFTAKNCLTCHTQPTGPNACNTCHGDFSNPSIIYPPQDLMDRDSSETVGAHVLHMQGLGNGPALVCGD
ncbi:MAG: cytochrome c3 family protein, partial [Ignavibacteriaceae bacterium]|nr:cytochrome c3 family protein [Ignavibacteriaceae bacterium]